MVFVKLDRPQGQYYGGAVAAPVTRATMEAALAANSGPLDLSALATVARTQRNRVATTPSSIFASTAMEPALPPLPSAYEAGDPRALEGLTLPDVSGLPARVAIRHLHRLGLRVMSAGLGDVDRSSPFAGTRVMPGDTIRLRYRGQTYD